MFRDPPVPVNPIRAVSHAAPLPGSLQVARAEPRLQAVSQAAFMSHPQRSEELLPATSQPATSAGSGNSDLFSDPFVDDLPAAPSQQQLTSPQIQMPDPTVEPAMQADPRPMNDLRGSAGTDSNAGGNLFDQMMQQGPGETAPEMALPETPFPEPSPGETQPPVDDGPSLGDILRDSTPDEPTEVEAELPEPRPLDRSDNDEFDMNPFDRLRNRDADQRDRDRLNSGEDAGDDDDQDGYGRGFGDNDPKPKAITCSDFRDRIRQETIDQVSLDISPPYRPDEIDMDRYQRLKSKFDDRQAFRQWRSIDGRELASGRLRDLAYEKAVIETEYGATEELPINRLSEGDLAYISENWGLPKECLIEQVAYTPRNWASTTVTWRASNLCHNPLYFEDVNLERYGHTHGPVLEPVVQSAHFFATIAVLPYKMGVHAPNECQYALGYYRPGSCAPWIKPPVPISARGAIAQAATMTGLFWLIP